MELLQSLVSDLERLERYLTSLLPGLHAKGDATAYVPDLEAATDRLIAVLGPSPDVVIRRFHQRTGRAGLICYLDNLVDLNQVDRDILAPLLEREEGTIRRLPVGPVARQTQWDPILDAILQRQTAVCLEAVPEAWLFDTAKIPQRSIDRPETEIAVRGPQEAFTDVLAIQLSQLRHRLATPHLVFEQLSLGTRYPVAVAMA
ncbi:spore germination protein, partial [Sulfobacillus harzensis]